MNKKLPKKLPAFQFYPADWRKDPGVQALGFFERGVWFEILCLLHESEDRGKLLLNGQPMPDDALARLLGLDKQVLTKTLTILLTYGVASRDPATGALANRRMVRDEELRKIRAECGKLGGNPVLLNQNPNLTTTTHLNQKSTPSSSSSASTEAIEKDRAPSLLAFDAPSKDRVLAVASDRGIGLDCAEAFWLEMEGCGWLDSKSRPIRKWEAVLLRTSMNWRSAQYQQRHLGKPPVAKPAPVEIIGEDDSGLKFRKL